MSMNSSFSSMRRLSSKVAFRELNDDPPPGTFAGSVGGPRPAERTRQQPVPGVHTIRARETLQTQVEVIQVGAALVRKTFHEPPASSISDRVGPERSPGFSAPLPAATCSRFSLSLLVFEPSPVAEVPRAAMYSGHTGIVMGDGPDPVHQVVNVLVTLGFLLFDLGDVMGHCQQSNGHRHQKQHHQGRHQV